MLEVAVLWSPRFNRLDSLLRFQPSQRVSKEVMARRSADGNEHG